MLNTTKKIITGAMLAGTLSGCGTGQQQKAESTGLKDKIEQATQKPIHHDALKIISEHQWRFQKQDGSEATIDDIQKWLGKNNSTVSFMLSACRGAVCPTMTKNLAELNDPNLKHIVISTDPSHDQMGELLKGTVTHNFLGSSLNPKNVYLLFPVGPEVEPKTGIIKETLKGGEQTAISIQHKMGLITDSDDPSSHSPFIQFFNKTGEKVTEADGNNPTALKEAHAQTLKSNQKSHER